MPSAASAGLERSRKCPGGARGARGSGLAWPGLAFPFLRVRRAPAAAARPAGPKGTRPAVSGGSGLGVPVPVSTPGDPAGSPRLPRSPGARGWGEPVRWCLAGAFPPSCSRTSFADELEGRRLLGPGAPDDAAAGPGLEPEPEPGRFGEDPGAQRSQGRRGARARTVPPFLSSPLWDPGLGCRPRAPRESPGAPDGPSSWGEAQPCAPAEPQVGQVAQIVQGAPNPANPLAHVPSELFLSPGQENLEGVA